jgi:F0F1-type ATP synthase membrane subunit b/b'
MLRQDSPNRIAPDRNGTSANAGLNGEASRVGGVDIQRELAKLEEMILEGSRLPIINRTLINEDQVLDQLELVQMNLHPAFEDAKKLLQHKEEILLEAEQYAQEIIETAERRAAQILDEMGLVRQAELEMKQIRQRVQQECEVAHEQAMVEIERMRRQTQQEIEDMRRRAIAECEEIQSGADDYADRILQDLEQQFSDMLRIVRNGRGQLQTEAPVRNLPRGGDRPKK